MGGLRASRWRSITSACSASPAATTATSRTARTRRAARSSSCSRRSATIERRRRARSGGPRTTAPPQVLRPAGGPALARAATASGGRTSAGSSPQARGDRLRRRSATSRKYPELRWLNKYCTRPAGRRSASASSLVGGWSALVWGFFVSTALLWHGTFTINSLSHVFGSRRYETTDDSRNNCAPRAHHDGRGLAQQPPPLQRSANQGFFWWEIDLTYYVLKGLEAVGLVWDVHVAPERVRFPERRPVGVQRRRGRSASRRAPPSRADALRKVQRLSRARMASFVPLARARKGRPVTTADPQGARVAGDVDEAFFRREDGA